jgi:hypothetical protein
VHRKTLKNVICLNKFRKDAVTLVKLDNTWGFKNCVSSSMQKKESDAILVAKARYRNVI